jgi:hypothetical protein
VGKRVFRNSPLLSQKKADHMKAVRAEIGRKLREQYGTATAQPLPNRLADLLRKIELSASES